MRSTLTTVYLLLTTSVLIACFQFSNDNCDTWTPGGITANRLTTEPPYTFNPSDMHFQPGDIITVKVGSKEDGPAFQNVFLQTVCDGTCPNNMYGDWSSVDVLSMVEDCGFDGKVAIYASKNEDRRSYSANWAAPADAPDQLSIWATIVYNDTTWWSEVKVAQLTKGAPPIGLSDQPPSLMCSSSQGLSRAHVLLCAYGGLLFMCLLFGK